MAGTHKSAIHVGLGNIGLWRILFMFKLQDKHLITAYEDDVWPAGIFRMQYIFEDKIKIRIRKIA